MQKFCFLIVALSCLASQLLAAVSVIAPPVSKPITSATQAITVTGLTAGTAYTFTFTPTSGAAPTHILFTASAGTNTVHIRFVQTTSATKVYVEENRTATEKFVTLPASLAITPGATLNVTVGQPANLTAAWKGFTYDDAVQLNTLLNAGSFTDSVSQKVTELFAFYYGKDELTRAQLITQIDTNTYLNTLKQKLSALSGADNSFMATVADNSLTTNIQTSSSSAISPTVAIDALGTFIAKRFREEINAAYIDRFRLTLLRPDSLHLLVPETFKVLRYSDPYNYTSFLQTLQESFDDDLRHLPFNTNQYMAFNRKKMVELMKSPVLFDLTASTLHVVSEIQDDKDAFVILSEIGNAPTTVNTADKRLKSAIRLTSVLSRNVTTGGITKGSLSFLTKTEWGNLRKDQALRNLFIGLMLERDRQTLTDISVPDPTTRPASSSSTVTLYKWMTDSQDKANQILRSADTISVALANLKTIKDDLKKEKDKAALDNRKPETVGLTFSLIEGGLNAVTTAINLTELIIPSATPTIAPLPEVRKHINTTRRLLPSVRYVFEKRYGMALSGVVTYLRELMPGIDSRTVVQSNPALERSFKKEIKKSKAVHKQLQKTATELTRLSSKTDTSRAALKKDFTTLSVEIDTLQAIQARSVANLTTALSLVQNPQPIDTSLQRCALRNTLTEKTGELMKYGTFMVTVVQSKTKDEMLQALETAALPVGSYRIKRNNWFNVSINSFGGIYGGRQFANEGDKTLIAPSAPIGAYIGWGKEQALVNTRKGKEPKDKQSTGNDGQSDGIFVSLLDVGAVAAFRLNTQNETTQLPELSWKNVLAPGIYYVHGLKNVLSVGIGIQYGPELSQLKNKETASFNPQAFRVGVKLTADIPIFNLYTKANRGATDRCKCR